MQGIIEVKNNVLKKGIHFVTKDYKTRNEKHPLHKGIDMVSCINGNCTTDYVICVHDGVVNTVSYNITSGYWVEVKHTNKINSRYLHLKKGSIKVKKGQKIKKGATIGYMGASGTVSGAHLHFGITVNNKITDPYPYLIDDSLFIDGEYTVGLYKTLTNMYVRTGAGTNYVPVKVMDLTEDGKKHATSKNPNAEAVYKKGTKFNVLEIKETGNQIWGRGYSGWVCLRDIKEYCIKC